jgi:hypothetical protein
MRIFVVPERHKSLKVTKQTRTEEEGRKEKMRRLCRFGEWVHQITARYLGYLVKFQIFLKCLVYAGNFLDKSKEMIFKHLSRLRGHGLLG